MPNSLDPDQDRHSVGPNLGPNCLKRLSADVKSHRPFLTLALSRLFLCSINAGGVLGAEIRQQ